jgi:hypothetical protein
VPVDHTRRNTVTRVQNPGDLAEYQAVDLTMGQLGFHFKQPGAYRIDAVYTNVDGGTATASMNLIVLPPATESEDAVIRELFDARVGAVMYVEGSRVLEDVNEKIEWIHDHLPSRHPLRIHLSVVLSKPLAQTSKVVDPYAKRLLEYAPDVDEVVDKLTPSLVENSVETADTLGHIWYGQTVNTYTRAAEQAGEPNKGIAAQRNMIDLFEKRRVIAPVLEEANVRLEQMRQAIGW